MTKATAVSITPSSRSPETTQISRFSPTIISIPFKTVTRPSPESQLSKNRAKRPISMLFNVLEEGGELPFGLEPTIAADVQHLEAAFHERRGEEEAPMAAHRVFLGAEQRLAP